MSCFKENSNKKKNWLGINVTCEQAQSRKKQSNSTPFTLFSQIWLFSESSLTSSKQLSDLFILEVEQFTQKPRQQSLKFSSRVLAIKYWASFFTAGIKSESLFLRDKVPEAQPPWVSERQSPEKVWLYGELQQTLWHGRNMGEIWFGSRSLRACNGLARLRVVCPFTWLREAQGQFYHLENF